MNNTKALLAAIIGLVTVAVSLGVLVDRLAHYACQYP